MTDLVLGPLLRHVGEHTAAIWVETADPATVTVTAGEHTATARTFCVHGHHYALVTLDGLEKGTKTPYRVESDGEPVWPLEESIYPDSVIPTLDHEKPLRMAFGSCRTSVAHDSAGNKLHGVDALRAYALRMAGVTDTDHDNDPDPGPGMRWPDLVLFLGDQVYADETSTEMRTFIEARRDVEEPPWAELKDYAEYAHLYKVAWSDPVNRWLLSTLPSAMIFDDHDVRDDWNTSLAWKDKMDATSWWHGRVMAGLSSYWVYQHLGNMSPQERAEETMWQRVVSSQGPEEVDLTPFLDDLAERVDRDPEEYRWSFSRDLAGVRRIVLDTRAARVLEPDRRAMLDRTELSWLDEKMTGGFRHVLVGASLPFLLPPGLHHLEAWNEAVAGGAWGSRFVRFGEWMRQTVDLEHWAAWQRTFQDVAAMTIEVAEGSRGQAPQSVTFLSGDVHHSYVSEVRRRQGSRIIQAVCSPIRNPLAPSFRFLTAVLAYAIAGPMGQLVSRSSRVSKPPFRWKNVAGPWFENSIGTLEDR
ncbi:MAG: alkaline phosphatase D family protein, partial [Aeromicrobium sp.]